MRYSVHVRCSCGPGCTKLLRADGSWNSRHGSAGFACRIPAGTGTRPLKRFGYTSKAEAKAAAEQVGKLLALASDEVTRAKVGDMIAATKRGADLPSAEDVRRRLMLGQDPGSTGVTFAEAWTAWLAGKRKLRQPAAARIEQIGDHWLIPAIGDVPLEQLSGAHCAAVFQRIERINTEIAAQQGEGRAFVHVEGDVRSRPRPLGIASQHRVYAALREFCNFEMRKTRRLAFNPVFAVELPQEITPEADHWSAAQTRTFLAATAGDPLHLAYRLILLRGLRRGEALGIRWADTDLDAGCIRVRQTLLKIGPDVVVGTPKTRAGERTFWLDQATTELLKAHRDNQVLQALEADTAWQDNDLIFCGEHGQPLKPDAVYRRFKVLARKAGLVPIKLHEGRHSAASMAREAEVDPEIRRKTLGHADAAMTSHYTHIEAAAHKAAAEAVARLVEEAGS